MRYWMCTIPGQNNQQTLGGMKNGSESLCDQDQAAGQERQAEGSVGGDHGENTRTGGSAGEIIEQVTASEQMALTTSFTMEPSESATE